MNVHVLQAPSLDLTEAVSLPEVVKRRPAQDWEQLVTEGHVLRERVLSGSVRRTLLATVSAAVAAIMAFSGPSLIDFRVPPA